MIFNNNGTGLASNIPMAEGYDGSCGAALALVESARNDYAMFRAMLDVDAREYTIRQESAGYVTESRLQALNESAISGIWNKIKELFTKLIAKIKSILHNFMARIRGVVSDGKTLVKKYGNEVLRKSNIDKLEVKWRKLNSGITVDNQLDSLINNATETNLPKLAGYIAKGDDSDTRWKKVVKKFDNNKTDVTNATEYREKLVETCWEDETPQKYEINETDAGSMRAIVNFVEGYEKQLKKFETNCRHMTKSYDDIVKEANKFATDQANASRTKDDQGNYPNNAEEMVDNANRAYEVSLIMQSIALITINFCSELLRTYYAQCKAAFMKGVTVSNKKLDEATLMYADAVAEAAAEEVETVIAGALTSEELSDLCAASKNVKDSDVSNDPDELTYGPDCYTEPSGSPYSRVNGSIDASIVGRNESALFNNVVFK